MVKVISMSPAPACFLLTLFQNCYLFSFYVFNSASCISVVLMGGISLYFYLFFSFLGLELPLISF